MKFLRMFGVILVVLVALLCVGLVHQANALIGKENSSLSELFVKNIREKLKPPALEVLSLSEFNNQNDADRALKSLETALSAFRKEFGSQLHAVDKAVSMPAQPAQGSPLVNQDALDDDDNTFNAPAAALGSLNPPSVIGIGLPEPIQPPAAILSSGPAGLPGPALPPSPVGFGVVPPLKPVTPVAGNLPAVQSVGSLPRLADQAEEDEGADFGGDDFGEFDLGGDLPPLGQQGIIQPLGGSQAPAPLPSAGGPLPPVAPLPASNPVPSIAPAINPFPVQNPAPLPSVVAPLPGLNSTPAPLPAIKPSVNPVSPAPKPLVAPVIAPFSTPLPQVAKAELLSDIPMVRKSKKIKSLDRKMDKMMVLGSVFQEAATKQALALASHQEQSKKFDLMSLDINTLPKVVTNNTFGALEQASIALAGLGDLE